MIPKWLREELNIQPGDYFDLEISAGEITLRPVRVTVPLIREQGVWALRTGLPLTASVTDDVLRQIRNERDTKNLGTLE